MSEKELPGTLPTNFTDEGYARFEADWLARKNDDNPTRAVPNVNGASH